MNRNKKRRKIAKRGGGDNTPVRISTNNTFLFKIKIKLQATIREMTCGHAKYNIKVNQR